MFLTEADFETMDTITISSRTFRATTRIISSSSSNNNINSLVSPISTRIITTRTRIWEIISSKTPIRIQDTILIIEGIEETTSEATTEEEVTEDREAIIGAEEIMETEAAHCLEPHYQESSLPRCQCLMWISSKQDFRISLSSLSQQRRFTQIIRIRLCRGSISR